MADSKTPPGATGEALEVRVQRLFFAMSSHAERSLTVRTERHHSRAATDVDVLATNYSPNFHRSVFHAECKGEKKAQTLDRAFWLAGLRKLLHADRSMLIVPAYEAEQFSFARELEIELVSTETLSEMEGACGVDPAWWPGRTDLAAWPALSLEDVGLFLRESEQLRSWTKDVLVFCQEEGWRVFSYSGLNRLLRLIEDGGSIIARDKLAGDALDLIRYVLSIAMVRLSHYMLAICEELLPRYRTEREPFLSDRLRFGDLPAGKMRQITESTAKMIRTALTDHGVTPPAQWTAENFMRLPTWTKSFVELASKLMDAPASAIHLPYAVELLQFGNVGPGPKAASDGLATGRTPAEQLRAFIVQGLHVPAEALAAPSRTVLRSIKGGAALRTIPRAEERRERSSGSSGPKRSKSGREKEGKRDRRADPQLFSEEGRNPSTNASSGDVSGETEGEADSLDHETSG